MPGDLTVLRADCLKWLSSRRDNSVDLVFGSPPYAEKGKRYIEGKPWPTNEWIRWMSRITVQAARVCRGYVLWVVNGAVRNGQYMPACEGLVWAIHRANTDTVCERPCIWHKNAPPNRRDWFGNDWEYVLAFKTRGTKPYFDWESIGTPPKYTKGGHFRQRGNNGERRRGGDYPTNPITRPRDVVRVIVGGGHMGHPLAHENEAPFPLALAEYFLKACCPPNGIVLDPFVGSGTTMHAAKVLGLRGIGIDNRQNQVVLSRIRLASITQ